MSEFRTSLKKVLRVLLFLLLFYFAWGFFDYDPDRTARRATAVLSSGSDIKIGVIWAYDRDYAFQTGVEAAVETVNDPGITFPDGSVHKLQPIYLDANDCKDGDSFGQRLRSLLDDHRIMAVMVEVPPNMANKAAVICEDYGCALLLSVRNDFRRNVGTFSYQINMCPPHDQFVSKINSLLEYIVPPGDGPIHIGLFFDATFQDAAIAVRSYAQDVEQEGTTIIAASKLRRAIATGNLNPQLTMAQLDYNHYLQSGLSDNPGEVDTLLRHGLGTQARDITLGQALNEYGPNQRPLKMGFVRPFLPYQESYAPLVAFRESERADVVVFLTDLAVAVPLVRELRRVQPRVPIINVDQKSRDFIREELKGANSDFYTCTALDPTDPRPAFVEFRQKFAARALAAGRSVTEANDKAVLGYQSILLLEDSLKVSGLATPIQLVNTIKYATKPWKIMGDSLVFDRFGEPANRDTYLLKYTSEGYLLVKPGTN